MRPNTKVIFIVGLGLTIVGAFQNCSSGNVPNTESTASVAATTPDLVAGSLVVIPSASSVTAGTTVTFSSTMTNVTLATYACTNAAGALVTSGSLTVTQTTFSLVVNEAVSCVFQGSGANLIAAVSSVVNVAITAPVASPSTPVVVAPAQTWTWQGLAYQTSCNDSGICDGVEWASCAGTACAAPKIQCYNASPQGQASHPVGSTQLTQPNGYMCIPLAANAGFVR